MVAPTEISSPKVAPNDVRRNFTSKPTEAARERAANRNLPAANPSSSTFSTPVTPPQSLLKRIEMPQKSTSVIKTAPLQKHREPPPQTGESKTPPPKNLEKQLTDTQTPIAVKPRVEKVESRAAETTIQQTIVPMRREQISNHVSERAEIPPTPTINVSIGRVEIRAVVAAPSAPSKQSNAKPPTLSLDDYLQKRRTGGGR